MKKFLLYIILLLDSIGLSIIGYNSVIMNKSDINILLDIVQEKPEMKTVIIIVLTLLYFVFGLITFAIMSFVGRISCKIGTEDKEQFDTYAKDVSVFYKWFALLIQLVHTLILVLTFGKIICLVIYSVIAIALCIYFALAYKKKIKILTKKISILIPLVLYAGFELVNLIYLK